jgi:RimK family alpha-L-glutamate ligase
MTNKNIKIALFFGGKITQHLLMIKKAAVRLGVELDLISYNRVSFDTETHEVRLNTKDLNDYDILFFRTTGKHWEEVNLILDGVKRDDVVVVDPLVRKGRPSDACKAYQMLALKRAGIEVPKTLYGSLFYLRDNASRCFGFPLIIKGSGGDRGTRVFKADNQEELDKLVLELRTSEVEEGKRYMAQEYIPNDGDYRILVLGKKVLGVMKRISQSHEEFRNNYSAGGKVEVAELPEYIKELAVKAADVCGLWVAGVDVAFKDFDINKPVIWEVNKGPQFKGFMQATGIDVPAEIVKFLVSLKDN